MAYRDDLDAAIQRADVLDQELNHTRGQNAHDAGRIADLERQLQGARGEIQRLGGGQPYPPPAYNPYGYNQLPRSSATMVLVFGILSLTVCGLFGPFAWYYGNAEIQKMDMGVVDASQRGQAVAGKVCGIIASSLMIAVFALYFLIFAVAVN